jgi:hypothetical protein
MVIGIACGGYGMVIGIACGGYGMVIGIAFGGYGMLIGMAFAVQAETTRRPSRKTFSIFDERMSELS